MFLWKYANPAKFMQLSAALLPALAFTAALSVATALVWGFFLTPNDYQQGATVKIIYLHVPAATMSINAWIMMLIASLIWLMRRHHVSALAAKATAPIGIIFTLIAITTGTIWGKPMWGTYWAWDPRLTSFMILLIFYFGYIALWQAIENHDTAADLTSILCIVGSVFAVLSRYAVNFWHQGLHQGSSLSFTGEQHVDNVFRYPLILSIIGFILTFIALVLLRTQTEIRRRKITILQNRLSYD